MDLLDRLDALINATHVFPIVNIKLNAGDDGCNQRAEQDQGQHDPAGDAVVADQGLAEKL